MRYRPRLMKYIQAQVYEIQARAYEVQAQAYWNIVLYFSSRPPTLVVFTSWL